jgi:hypothetical protein
VKAVRTGRVAYQPDRAPMPKAWKTAWLRGKDPLLAGMFHWTLEFRGRLFMARRTNGLLINLLAFIGGRMVPRLHATFWTGAALPKEAGLEWKSLEIPDGVGDLLANFAGAFS